MAWKGVILEKSLEDKSLLKLAKIIHTKKERLKTEDKIMTFHNIEVDDKTKEDFIKQAIKAIKPGFYMYIVKDKVMHVIFRDHMFKFTRGYPELETARDYGLSVGIPKERMPFERLIENPWD